MSDRVLFVSGRCEHCKKILIGIQQHSFLKPLFKVVNVDTQPYPNYVKSVPSILINSQVISGQTVFEYFGKLVEGKKAQEGRVENNQTNSSDQGQCRINEDGELEGYCGSSGLGGSGVEFSMITEENDDKEVCSWYIKFCDDGVLHYGYELDEIEDDGSSWEHVSDNEYIIWTAGGTFCYTIFVYKNKSNLLKTQNITFSPITKKPLEVRMGKGKGAPEYFVAVVKPGRVLFEISGVSLDIAKEALRLAAQKLPVKTKFIIARDMEY